MIAPTTLVVMANNTFCQINHLKKGDVVLTLNGPTAVECIIQKFKSTYQFNDDHDFTVYGPFNKNHPIIVLDENNENKNNKKINKKYQKAKDVYNNRFKLITQLFDVVLENRSDLIVWDDTEDKWLAVATLAHQKTNGYVYHELYGTNKIIDNLKSIMPNMYEQGYIDMSDLYCIRDYNGHVTEYTV